ncbi:hypothetical protein SAMN05216389_1387 [Oceanobacillus limi]|uniref:Uncharacterized protein n=1 Tax=Oceanobacillus limi TaxID=930131 RepID=A0A1I0HK57_9BACI|nr:hypothetical protein [Oceanobacillus limi]SET84352.1 hypothetical protein SAMN05216389_1387 [Oceanobacillus limi]
MSDLYKEEQKLLNKLVESENDPDKEYQNAVKRTIGRINDEMKEVEEE